MKQVIVGGYYNALNIATTEYASFAGSYNWGGYNGNLQIITTPGTLRNLRVELDDVPGTGTYTFSLWRAVGTAAGAITTLTCTVAADGTIASDTAHDVAVAVGDAIALQCDPDSPDNARYARWTIEFEGDNANESLILSSTTVYSFQTSWVALGGYGHDTEVNCRRVCPTSGVIKNLYVQLNGSDPGTDPDAYKYTLRIANAGNSYVLTDTTLTCTITADDRTGHDTVHEITVAAGDWLTIEIEPLNSPTNAPFTSFGLTFEADIDGESIIWGGSTDNLSNTDTEYNDIAGYKILAWTATEAQRYQLAQSCTLKKLYMLLSGDPGGTDKYTFTVRLEGASPASGLTVEIAGGSTTGNDTTHTIAVSDGNTVNMMVVPTDTPAVVDAYWGLVCYIVEGDYPISSIVYIGVKPVVTRKIIVERASAIIVGVLASASKGRAAIASAVAIGVVASATRVVAFARASKVSVGVTVSVIKSWITQRLSRIRVLLVSKKSRVKLLLGHKS